MGITIAECDGHDLSPPQGSVMMQLRNLALSLVCILGCSGIVQARITTTITVTTFADENGTNTAACSLREAVQAVNSYKAYGGCPAGVKSTNNVIQLKAGTYNLTGGQLVVLQNDVAIAGQDTQRPNDINPYTGFTPNRVRPNDPTNGTYITATTNKRLLFASTNVTLQDVVLTGNGTVPLSDSDGNGALIYNTGTLTLDNVIVKSGHAAANGGAIFLATDSASITASDTSFDSNQADGLGSGILLYGGGTLSGGGAIAMSCLGDNGGPPASHTLTFTRSLFNANTSTTGAGVLAACSSSTISLSASTLSGNNSNAASAAIDYQQPATFKQNGSLVLSYVTAAENINGVLITKDIGSMTISASLLAYNPGGSCKPSNPLSSGGFNATDDANCTAVFMSSSTNLTVTTPLTTEFQSPATAPSDYLDYHGGLTKNYLPGSASLFVKDKAGALTGCASTDQRNLSRVSGGSCDIGAVELLQPTAAPATASSLINTDRLAIVDVLLNDTFGETAAGALGYDSPAVVIDIGTMASPSLPFPSTAECVWYDNNGVGKGFGGNGVAVNDTNVDYKNRLVVRNAGNITPASAPATCTYRVVDGDAAHTQSQPALVTVTINDVAPVAVADVYLRPQGTRTITFNPLLNDNNDGNGIYGKPALWATYPIYIAAPPGLGTIKGASFGNCPDWSTTNLKTCLQPPLTYTAYNNDSPFSDTFTYSVYDHDGKASTAATVTINTDASDQGSGQGGGGSLDLLGGFTLLLIGLRRKRKL
jgi:CSLREA domain-containing protein